MRTLLRRHSTLLAFSLSLGASTAFVACGSDDTATTGTETDAGSGGSVGTGGGSSTGGTKASGGTPGTGGGKASGGTPSSGGTGPTDSGSDVTSNGDAQTD